VGWLAATLFIFSGLGIGYWLYRQEPKTSAEINLTAGDYEDNANTDADGSGGDGGGD
jgi:hypothetical protein